MDRVRIWVSAVPGVSDTLLINRGDGTEEVYGLNVPPDGLKWLGSGYWNPLQGIDGTAYDLPRGFPADNADAARRLNDPSISNSIRNLIRLNFPLQQRARRLPQSRRIA